MNRITPMEIFDKDFRTTMRGYDIKEVDRFLDLVLQSYEDVLNENEKLKEQVRRLKRENKQNTGNHRHSSDLAAYDKVIKEILMRLERLEKLNFG